MKRLLDFRFRRCPGCRKHHRWKYGRPILFASVVVPAIVCKNVDPDRVYFSYGQPHLKSWDA